MYMLTYMHTDQVEIIGSRFHASVEMFVYTVTEVWYKAVMSCTMKFIQFIQGFVFVLFSFKNILNVHPYRP